MDPAKVREALLDCDHDQLDTLSFVLELGDQFIPGNSASTAARAIKIHKLAKQQRKLKRLGRRLERMFPAPKADKGPAPRQSGRRCIWNAVMASVVVAIITIAAAQSPSARSSAPQPACVVSMRDNYPLVPGGPAELKPREGDFAAVAGIPTDDGSYVPLTVTATMGSVTWYPPPGTKVADIPYDCAYLVEEGGASLSSLFNRAKQKPGRMRSQTD
jgi:hypothetical protein